MALNSTGPISLAGTTAGQSIELENGGNGTTQISLNDTAVRTLAGVPTGAITMPTNFWGKANRVSLSYTFSANTADAALNITSIGGYSAGKSDITITVNSGIYLYATSTGGAGLSLTGGTSGDTLTLVNNGYIMGMGGRGDSGRGGPNGQRGGAGGTALSIAYPITINNTNASAYIGGGGGGGAGGAQTPVNNSAGGGGAGGGAGGGDASNLNPGAGGGIGSSGSTSPSTYGGGGGGRIFPGVGGTGGNAAPGGPGGGGGGAGGGGAGNNSGTIKSPYWSPGGAGGSANNAGGTKSTPIGYGGGGGGGWGASGGSASYSSPYPGYAGGKAVALNANSVTWTSGNTTRVYGSVA